MAASHWPSAGPEFSLLSAARTFERADISRTEGPVSAAPSALSSSHWVTSARLPIGIFLYLVSLGVVGAGTIGVFFGSAFTLLVQPHGQVLTSAHAHDRDPVDSARFAGPSVGAEDDAPASEPVSTPGSMVAETTITASVETTALNDPAPSSKTAPTPPPRGGGSDRLKFSRVPNPRSNKMPGGAIAVAGRSPSAKQHRDHDPEEYAAASTNQREYDQLQRPGPP